MIVLFRLRGDTAANLASINPVLARKEVGVEEDTLRTKVGDGATPWSDLPYAWGPLSDFLLELSKLTVAPNTLVAVGPDGKPQFLPVGGFFAQLAGASSAASARELLGLGTMATQSAGNVSITGGTISGTNLNQ